MATAAKTIHAHDWRAQLGAKLVSPDEAVSHIRSGDRITMSLAQKTPYTICAALAGRLMEIENVVLNHSAAFFNWDLPGLGERFRLESFYVSPVDRGLFTEQGRGEFVPMSYYRDGTLPPGLDNFNVYLMTVSPPDANGFVNFGEFQIMSKLLARAASLVIAEIDPTSIPRRFPTRRSAPSRQYAGWSRANSFPTARLSRSASARPPVPSAII